MENHQDFVIKETVLKKYTGPGGNVVIPAGVTEIESSAFYRCSRLSSITIPNSVTKIGDSAFSDSGLTNAVIPGNVKEIGNWAFSYCASLTNITISEGVSSIGNWAFLDCTALTSLSLPEGITKIGRYAFRRCTGLNSITIPGSVTTGLDNSMFWGCGNLTQVTFGGKMRFTKTVFRDSRPALIAPHIPIACFDQEDKPGAVLGFAKLYEDGAGLDEEIRTGYLKYIKGQKKKLYPAAVQHEELLQLMIAEKMLVRKDIDPLLEECDRQNNVSAKAAVLDYAGRNLKPVDPVKDLKLKDL